MFDAELKCLTKPSRNVWRRAEMFEVGVENTWSAILDFLPPNSPTKQTHNKNSPLPFHPQLNSSAQFVVTFLQRFV
jgi:hypothetical protein